MDRALDQDKIVATLDKLQARIGECFPNAGLVQMIKGKTTGPAP